MWSYVNSPVSMVIWLYVNSPVCMVVCMVVVIVTYIRGYSRDMLLIGLWMFSMVYGPKTSHGR